MRGRAFSLVLAVVAVLALAGSASAQVAPSGQTARVDGIIDLASTRGVPPVAPGTFVPTVQATDDASAGFGAVLVPYVTDLDAWFASNFGWRPSTPVTFLLFSSGDSLVSAVEILRGSPASPEDRNYILSWPSFLLYAANPGFNVQPGGVVILVNTDLDAAAQTALNVTSTLNFKMNIRNKALPPVSVTRTDGMRLTQASMARNYAIVMENDVAGGIGPTFYREGLADAVTFLIVPATPMESVWPLMVAQFAYQNPYLGLASLQHDWSGTTGSGGAIYDVARGMSFMAANALLSRVGGVGAVDILRATASGQGFESALQSISGWSLHQLNGAMKSLTPVLTEDIAP